MEIKLKVIRDVKQTNVTTGLLLVNDEFFCYTLEDEIRESKITGKTAIPKGVYTVVINYSARFSKMMPLILNVPNFKGVRIHSGNTPNDTEGCILVGEKRTDGIILDSKKAFTKLFKQIQRASVITLQIVEVE